MASNEFVSVYGSIPTISNKLAIGEENAIYKMKFDANNVCL